jgi:predicted anti-sigma-YlaC factor YlaD
MAHNPYELMISLSLDGMLNDEEEFELQSHLADCETCADTFERMALVDTVLVHAGEVAPPVNFAASVMLRIEAEETGKRWYPWLIGTLVVASVLAAISIAAPILFLSIGVERIINWWPALASLVEGSLSLFEVLLTRLWFISSAVTDWYTYLLSDPAALAVVVTALVCASIWIGFLEVSKVNRSVMAGQAA